MKGRVWSNREKRYLSHDENFCLALAEYCDRSEERDIYQIVVCNPDWQSYDLVQDDDLIFEMSSGLEDKNGKEICIGDVVSEHHGDIIGEIVQKPSGEYRIAWIGIFGGESVLYDHRSLCEVIGNIHENPELLERKG